MIVWQIFCIVAISFLILEIFTPSLFFLNFALAAFLTAGISFAVKNIYTLIFIFFLLSFVSFAFLRPILVKRFSKETNTGLEGKYIGNTAKVIEEVSNKSGVISIYDERWEARTTSETVIPQGADVKIIKNDSLIMYVEQI